MISACPSVSLFKTRLGEGVSTRETKYISVPIWFLKQNKIHKREKIYKQRLVHKQISFDNRTVDVCQFLLMLTDVSGSRITQEVKSLSESEFYCIIWLCIHLHVEIRTGFGSNLLGENNWARKKKNFSWTSFKIGNFAKSFLKTFCIQNGKNQKKSS